MPHLRHEYRPLNRFARCNIGTIDPPVREVRDLEAEHEERIRRLEEFVAKCLPKETHNATTRPIVVNGKEYNSVRTASHYTGIPEQTIRDACGGCRAAFYNHKTGKRESFTAEWCDGVPCTRQSAGTR